MGRIKFVCNLCDERGNVYVFAQEAPDWEDDP